MNNHYEIIVIGSGPGGYVAAIRSAQLGFKTAIIEKEHLGGICLNWGCIPTKALLKSATVFNYAKHAAEYGINIETPPHVNFTNVIQRSRNVANTMSKGVQYLLKKNNIEIINGFAKLMPDKKISVTDNNNSNNILSAENIIIATGARPKELPNIKIDNNFIINYKKALALEKQPETMLVIGSGAIGTELAYLYNSIGTKITLVEFMPNIVPLEDEEVSRLLERSLKKDGINILTNASVEKVDIVNNKCNVTIKTTNGIVNTTVDIVLSAVGITPNIDNIGLEETGIITENNKIKVNQFYQTNIPGYFAIGDIVAGPALAHKASAEAIICVEKIANLNPNPIDYTNIPSCIYTSPEIASVGITEKIAKEKNLNIKIAKFPYTASGKATASGNRDGFVKLIFDKDTNILLGAHLIGENVTEMIAELVIAKRNNLSPHNIHTTIHPHPTMSEAIMEAAAAADNVAIHI